MALQKVNINVRSQPVLVSYDRRPSFGVAEWLLTLLVAKGRFGGHLIGSLVLK